jgi:hypothetical protein
MHVHLLEAGQGGTVLPPAVVHSSEAAIVTFLSRAITLRRHADIYNNPTNYTGP